LIAKKVGSIQYQLAQQQQHQIPVVSPEWVHSCWEKQKLVPHKDFLLPPFAGCVISVTGLSASTRNEIQRLAKAYGGEYTPNLTKRCTHLISRVPQGIKYRYALEWGLHCVSIQWFFDSINLQVCADETQYFLPMSEATRQALFNPLSTSPRDLNRLSPALRKKHLMQLHRKRHPSPPYDLYIISSAPFPRIGPTATGRSGLRFRMDSNPSPYMPQELPPLLADLKSDVDDDDDDLASFKKKSKRDNSSTDEIDSEPTLEDLASDPEAVAELHKLLALCDQTILHYTELAKTIDLSPYLELLNKSMVVTSMSDIDIDTEMDNENDSDNQNVENETQIETDDVHVDIRKDKDINTKK